MVFHHLHVLMFPAAEVVFILSAWSLSDRHVIASGACVLLGAVALNYSLHIAFHEVVHRKYFQQPGVRWIAEPVITVLLGTPFGEYRQSHWRHHRYTNLLQDATSTWRGTVREPKPRRLWSYSLGWPAITVRSVRALVRERRNGNLSIAVTGIIAYEVCLLLAFHVYLVSFLPALWIVYCSTIYLGYVGIAATNYLQHPPIAYGSSHTTSIYHTLYNQVFFNNGLHFEHHHSMQEPIIDLRAPMGCTRLYMGSSLQPKMRGSGIRFAAQKSEIGKSR